MPAYLDGDRRAEYHHAFVKEHLFRQHTLEKRQRLHCFREKVARLTSIQLDYALPTIHRVQGDQPIELGDLVPDIPASWLKLDLFHARPYECLTPERLYRARKP